MSDFLRTQMDYIFFCYGLAFVLLGAVCLVLERSDSKHVLPWRILGLFGLIHGMNEWLDMVALDIGDTDVFVQIRLLALVASFALLIEFVRLGALRLGRRMPGRWIHLPLLVAVILGETAGGLNGINTAARYLLGLGGALGSAWLFALFAAGRRGIEKSCAKSLSIAFALYGIAAGAIVPSAPAWLPTGFDQAGFFQLVGMPIQLLRGIFAGWIAISLWGLSVAGRGSAEAASQSNDELTRWFVSTGLALATILLCGWLLTDYLGRYSEKNLQENMSRDLDLLNNQLKSETIVLNSIVKLMAESPALVRTLAGAGPQKQPALATLLQRHRQAAAASLACILDTTGAVIACSHSGDADQRNASNPNGALWFRQALGGNAGQHFSRDVENHDQDYLTSHPVRDSAGRIIGVALLKTHLGLIESEMQHFEDAFLVDPAGVIYLSSRPEFLLRSLWLSASDMTLIEQPLLAQRVSGRARVSLDGQQRYLAERKTIWDNWHLVTLQSSWEIGASRALGIAITLLLAVFTLFYFAEIQRTVRDKLKLARQLELEELAHKLDIEATVDPLTGVFNRLKFNRELSAEVTRATRYGAALSLVMFDIDHFKRVNDTYGHRAGDDVLVGLCQVVSQLIRQTDLLARWGGEEFMILCPACDLHAALLLAEKVRAAVENSRFELVGALTCSFGVTQFQTGDDAESITARTDQALYAAKNAGRNRVASSDAELAHTH